MINFFKTLYIKIKEPLAFISSVISIILVFYNNENKIFTYILSGIVLIYLITICSYIVKTIFDTNKAKNALERKFFVKNKELATEMHKFFHNLRDYSSSLYSLNILTLEDVKDRCVHICNYIELIYNQLFKEYLGDDKVSVCIKLIKNDSIFDADYNNWEMLTIARSNTTDQKRNRIDDVSVEMIKIDGKYVSKELTAKIGNLKGKSLILGFMCIDSMKIFESSEEKDIFKIGIEYAKMIADSLYLLFEKVLICCIENDTIKKVN